MSKRTTATGAQSSHSTQTQRSRDHGKLVAEKVLCLFWEQGQAWQFEAHDQRRCDDVVRTNHPSSTRLLSLWKTSSNTSTSGSCHNRLPIHLISAPFRSLHPFSSSLFLGLHLKGNSYSRENGKGRFTHFIYHQVPAAVSLRTNRLRRFGPPWTTINAIKLVPVMKAFFCKFGPYGR